MKGHYTTKRRKTEIAGILFLAVLFLTCATSLTFTKEGENTCKIEELVSKRIDIMNGFLAGEMSFLNAERQLALVESDALLEKDMQALSASESMDLEYIEKYIISSVTFTKKEEDLFYFVVEIQWKLAGLNGNESLESSYSVVCKQRGESLKIVEIF